jgi:hypothetical protein
MSPSPTQYQRLPGSGYKSGGSFFAMARTRCRLWLAADHLLQVETEFGMVESYKRFYFRDLQACLIRPTRDLLYGGIVFGSLISLLLLWAWGVGPGAGRVTLVVFAVGLAVIAIWQQLFGRNCVCHFKTAVQTEEIPSLKRLRRVQKILGRIRPLIAQAQGEISAEQLATEYGTMLERANSTPGNVGTLVGKVLESTALYRSRAHQILFFALLADAATSLVILFWQHLALIALSALVGLVYLGATVLALVKQHGTNLSRAVRALTWVVAVYAGLSYLVSYIVMMVMGPAQNLDGTQLDYFKALANLDPFTTTWWLVLLLVHLFGSALFGVLGLLLLNRYWRERLTAPPLLNS